MTDDTKGIIYITLAGICWSTIGIFAKILMANNFTSYEVAFVRLFFGALLLSLYFLKQNKGFFLISKKSLVFTFFMGVITQGIFNIVFFSSISLIGVINATILLYLAPIFITCFSVIFFKENLTLNKKTGVILSVIGSFLALTGGMFIFQNISPIGLVFGVLSGLGYSLVSIFCKFGLKKNHAETLIFYSFIFGLIFISGFFNPLSIVLKINNIDVILAITGLALLPAAAAYIFYFKGISTGIDLSRVGVLSMIELILSIIWSVIFLNEALNSIKVFGIALILFSIFLINKREVKY